MKLEENENCIFKGKLTFDVLIYQIPSNVFFTAPAVWKLDCSYNIFLIYIKVLVAVSKDLFKFNNSLSCVKIDSV